MATLDAPMTDVASVGDATITGDANATTIAASSPNTLLPLPPASSNPTTPTQPIVTTPNGTATTGPSGGTGTTQPAARSAAQQLMRMNQYFRTHSLAHTDQNRSAYQEYLRTHAGAEPPITIFQTPAPTIAPIVDTAAATSAPQPVLNSTTTSTPAPVATSAGAGAGIPASSPPSSGASTSASGSTSASASGASGSGSTSSSSGRTSISHPKNLELVKSIVNNAYRVTHDGQSVKYQRMTEISQIVMSLKTTNNMTAIQQNLMISPGQVQRTGSSGSTSSVSSSGSSGQLSALPPGSNGYVDPRMRGPVTANSNSNAAAQAQQQRGYDPRQAANPNAAGAASMNPNKRKDVPGMNGPPQVGSQGGQQKYRRENLESSAPDMRTQHMQNSNLSAPSASSSSPYPPHASPTHRGRPMPPTNGNQPIAASSYSPAQYAANSHHSSSRQGSHQLSSLLSLWQSTKLQQADQYQFYLDPRSLIQKVHTIALQNDLGLASGDQGIATLELITLATETFLKNLVQGARYASRRRADLSKSYLPHDITNEPRKDLDSLQRSQEERKLRWAKHREREDETAKRKAAAAATSGETSAKKEAEAAALQAKLDAAIAEAEKSTREAAAANASATTGAVASAVDDDYITALLGGGGLTGSSATSTSQPTNGSSSFLPPSALPPSSIRSFLPSSSLATGITSTTSTVAALPSITVADIVTVLESDAHLRKSSRIYHALLTVIGKKRDTSHTSLQAPSSSTSASAHAPSVPSSSPPNLNNHMSSPAVPSYSQSSSSSYPSLPPAAMRY